MNIQIDSQLKTEDGFKCVSATCGKVSGFASVSKDGSMMVCCKNASHKAFRGAGRWFANAFEAQAAYKSDEMKTIIRAAVAL